VFVFVKNLGLNSNFLNKNMFFKDMSDTYEYDSPRHRYNILDRR
jgi:hypothetical protein